jgi:hypothetical protein
MDRLGHAATFRFSEAGFCHPAMVTFTGQPARVFATNWPGNGSENGNGDNSSFSAWRRNKTADFFAEAC